MTSRCSSSPVLALPVLSGSCSLSSPSRSIHCSGMPRYRSQFSVRPLCLYCIRRITLLLHVWLYHLEATIRVQFSLPFSLLFLYTLRLFTHKRGRLSWGGGLSYRVYLTFRILSLFPLVQPGHSHLLADTSKLISSSSLIRRRWRLGLRCALFRSSSPLIGPL